MSSNFGLANYLRQFFYAFNLIIDSIENLEYELIINSVHSSGNSLSIISSWSIVKETHSELVRLYTEKTLLNMILRGYSL